MNRFVRAGVVGCVVLAGLHVSSGSAAAQVAVDGYWRLGEDDPGAAAGALGAATTVDRSGRGMHLARVGAPTYSATVPQPGPGSALAVSFPGGSRYEGPIVTSAIDNVGIEAWVRPAAIRAQMIAYNGTSGPNGFGLYQNHTSFALLYGGVVLHNFAPVQLNQWTNLAVVRANGVTTAYVNGVLVMSGAIGGPHAATGLMHIGGNSGPSTGEAFVGLVDEVRVFRFGAGQFHPAHLLVNQQPGPPIANAGADFSVNEQQPLVTLDGAGSAAPWGGTLTYAWTQLPGTTPVHLSNATGPRASFTAPDVAAGGETLSFVLTVTANGRSATDTVSVTVVNVNHAPVAEAGPDQWVAEGAPVTLQGERSFDVDTDPFSHAWVQVGGNVAVELAGADTANPTFTAPYVDTGGAPGVVATLVFELRVDDGFPADAPAPGYTLASVTSRVTVHVTNVNNAPAARPGDALTVDENTPVALNGSASSDPDGDALAYTWEEVGGATVILDGATTPTPSFTAPFVGPGGRDLSFRLTVTDGYGGSASAIVTVHVQNVNDPPLASAARPTTSVLWPPNHGMVMVGITGVTDPDNNATITITGVTQDEPTNGLGDGDTAVDAVINPDGTVLLRAERSGKGDGRVYRITFTASDAEGSADGAVTVTVPHSAKRPAVDSGQRFNSTR